MSANSPPAASRLVIGATRARSGVSPTRARPVAFAVVRGVRAPPRLRRVGRRGLGRRFLPCACCPALSCARSASPRSVPSRAGRTSATRPRPHEHGKGGKERPAFFFSSPTHPCAPLPQTARALALAPFERCRRFAPLPLCSLRYYFLVCPSPLRSRSFGRGMRFRGTHVRENAERKGEQSEKTPPWLAQHQENSFSGIALYPVAAGRNAPPSHFFLCPTHPCAPLPTPPLRAYTSRLTFRWITLWITWGKLTSTHYPPYKLWITSYSIHKLSPKTSIRST